MADLNEIQSSQSVKLAGAGSPSGIETNWAAVDINGGLSVAGEGIAGSAAGGVITVQGALSGTQVPTRDLINISGQNRAQAVSTVVSEALGGATILVNRKFISITPTNGIVYWGFTAGVTIANGTPIFNNQTQVFGFTDNVRVYLVALVPVDCRIAEGS